jgi:hypothetical protein
MAASLADKESMSEHLKFRSKVALRESELNSG